MKVVVGLGNPGPKYAETRHNVGWMVLDRLSERAGLSGRGRERDAAVSVRGRVGGHDVLLVKPLTFMNDSGIAVRKVLARERVQLEDMLVVVDDFALPLGRLRFRPDGTHGGHNGLRSITAELETQRFARLRVGIGEPRRNAIDHVLSRFAPDERPRLAVVLDAASDAVETWLGEGPARAANQWNGWSADGPGTAGPAAAGSGATAGAAGAAARTSRDNDGDGEGVSGTDAEARPRPAGTGAAPGPGEIDGPPGADGVRRTRTGWRRILPGTPRDEGR